MTHPISRFPVPEIDSLPQDLKDRIIAVQEKAGFITCFWYLLTGRRSFGLSLPIMML